MLNVALLGSGFMGSVHSEGWKAMEGRARVALVCSRTEAAAGELAASLGARTTTDLLAAATDPQIDVVDICLPTPLHREVAEAAFAAGKHVLLEKPIALTVEDALAIVAAAERSQGMLLVGLVVRFWPEYVELQRRLAAGELGRPIAVSASRRSGPPDWNTWMADESQSGGMVLDLMSHDLDQVNWLLGRPRRVFARAAHPNHVQALLEYDGGASGFVEGSWAMPKSHPFTAAISVVAEGGAAEYTFSAAPVAEGNVGAAGLATGLRLFPAEGEATTAEVESGDPWARQIASFVDCIEGGRPPEQGTGEQAVLALETALAVSRSLASGQPVAL